MAAAKLRSSCSFPNLLLSCLNLLLSSASLAPILVLKLPPAPLAYAFLLTSTTSIISSFIGLCLTHICFMAHLSLLLTSSLCQLLSFIALFTRERSCLEMLKSPGGNKEGKVLVRLECGVLMSMLLLQVLVLVVSCFLHCWWVREFECLEAEKWRRNKVRVQQEQVNSKVFNEPKMNTISEK